MNNNILTERLLAVSSMISGTKVADIGTDHGKLLIYLAMNNRLQHGIGSDVNVGPAESCSKNVSCYGYQNLIETRVGDGLETLCEGEADTIVIAGMGGELILNIINLNLDIALSAKEIVLQPMTNIHRLLLGLIDLGFTVVDGRLAKEKDKLYQIFKIKKGINNTQKLVDEFISPVFREKNDPLLDELLKREIKKVKAKIKGLGSAELPDYKEIEISKKLLEELENYEA